MKKSFVQSPTRIDLAGGTTDLWPLDQFVGGSITVNFAIDIFTTAVIEPIADSARISVWVEDFDYRKEFADLQEFLQCKDKPIKLIQEVSKYFSPTEGFSIHTKSESPAGGGLGGSSSLIISLLKAFADSLGKSFRDVNEMVYIAHNLEARVLGTPTGVQDYFPAALGGLNFISKSEKEIQVQAVPLKGSQFCFLLIDTVKAHHSGLNNFEVLKSAVAGDAKVLKALHEIKQIAVEMDQVCRASQWNELAGLFDREYLARIQLTPAFTSKEIESIRKLTENFPGSSVKICGAGGGGCVLIWTPLELKEKIEQECLKLGFRSLNAHPVDPL